MDEKELYITALQILKTIQRGNESYSSAIEKIYTHYKNTNEISEAIALNAMINFIKFQIKEGLIKFENANMILSFDRYSQVKLIKENEFSFYFGKKIDTYLCQTAVKEVHILYSDSLEFPVCEF